MVVVFPDAKDKPTRLRCQRMRAYVEHHKNEPDRKVVPRKDGTLWVSDDWDGNAEYFCYFCLLFLGADKPDGYRCHNCYYELFC